MGFATGAAANAMFINSSQQVGIGTSSPGHPLDILGSNETVGSGSSQLAVFSTSAYNTANTGGSIGFQGKKNSGGDYSENAWIGGLKENTTDGNDAGYLAFGTRPNGGAVAERMRITSAGRVGIGSVAPDGLLHVSGTGADVIAKIECTHSVSSAMVEIVSAANRDSLLLFKEDSTVKARIYNDATEESLVITDGANASTLYVKDEHVGIGTASPSALLDVNGSIKGSSVHTHSDTASASGTATVTVGNGGMGIWAAQFGYGNDAEYKCGFWWSIAGNSSVQVHTVDTGANGNSTNCDITMSAADTTISAAFGSKSGATGALKVMSLGFN